jgi:DNA-binding transcriptional LysR family regulator
MQLSDWSDYQAFLAIARAGQLSRGAKALGIDATTLGRRLRRLEARLGQTLFEQTREGQVLTEAGEALLASVEAMAVAASQIVEEPADAEGPNGTLRISVSEGFGTWILAPHLPEFVSRYPGLVVDLVANSSYLSLSKREADVAIFLSRPRAGPLVAQKLTDYALRMYASPDYLAKWGLPGNPSDLASGHRLIGYIPDLLYAPELGYLHEIHPGLTAKLRSSSINAQQQLLVSGAGIGVLPCFIGDRDPALVPIMPEISVTRSFWLVTHRDTHQLAKVDLFKNWLRQIISLNRFCLMPPRPATRLGDG